MFTFILNFISNHGPSNRKCNSKQWSIKIKFPCINEKSAKLSAAAQKKFEDEAHEDYTNSKTMIGLIKMAITDFQKLIFGQDQNNR